MNIQKGIFKTILLFILIGVFFFYRYLSIGINIDQVLAFSIYYSVAVIALIISLVRFKNFINPISIYTIFIFLLSYSFIRLSNVQKPYSLNTYFILNISIIAYLVFAYLDFDFKPVRIFKLSNNLKKILLYFICLASVITFVLECIAFGYLPVLNIASSDVYIETNAKLIPFLHYFIVMLAFVPAWAYILFKEGVVSKKEFHILFFITLFVLVNYLSRQLYLLFGITLFVSYSYYNYVNKKYIFRGIIIIVSFFLLIGYLKFNSEVEVSFSEFSRLAAGIDNDHVTILESTFTEYSSKRYAALDQMVRYSDKIDYYGMGIYTFRPFFSFFLLEKTGVIKRLPELDSEKNVGTYVIDPYLDFGLFGVLIINMCYGYLSSRYFKQYRKMYPEAIIKFSVIVFCIMMGMFINYFNTMLIWIGLIFNKILIGGLSKQKES